MLKTLPTLLTLGGLLFIACGAGEGGASKLFAQEDASTNAASSAPTDSTLFRGQALVAAAAVQMMKEPSLEAKIRHRVNVNGHELFGTGIYQQLGAGEEKLLRLELKTQLDDQTVTLQQICGDRFFWIRKDMPQGKKSLSRVSLWQVREAVHKTELVRPNFARHSWMMLGGLSRLMEELNLAYEFKPPQPGKLGSVPVWNIVGEAPARLRTKLNLPPDQDPPQFPSHVIVTLGRDDVLPLFPYRIEYQQGRGEERTTLMALEMYEVRRRSDLDPRSFDYDPGEQEVEDVTKAWLTRLGLK